MLRVLPAFIVAVPELFIVPPLEKVTAPFIVIPPLTLRAPTEMVPPFQTSGPLVVTTLAAPIPLSVPVISGVNVVVPLTVRVLLAIRVPPLIVTLLAVEAPVRVSEPAPEMVSVPPLLNDIVATVWAGTTLSVMFRPPVSVADSLEVGTWPRLQFAGFVQRLSPPVFVKLFGGVAFTLKTLLVATVKAPELAFKV
jgi:hypothetical protein